MPYGPVYRALTRAMEGYALRYHSPAGNTRTPRRIAGQDARARHASATDDFIYTGNVWIRVVMTHHLHGYEEGLHHVFTTTQM